MRKLFVWSLIAMLMVGCGPKPGEQAAQKGDSKAYIDAGMEYLKNSDIANAIRSFDMAIKTNPQDPENYIVLGQVYLRLKNYQGAVDTLSAAIKVDAENGEAYYFLATSRMMRAQPGDKEQAIEDAKKSAELFLKDNDQERFKKAVVLVQGFTQAN